MGVKEDIAEEDRVAMGVARVAMEADKAIMEVMAVSLMGMLAVSRDTAAGAVVAVREGTTTLVVVVDIAVAATVKAIIVDQEDMHQVGDMEETLGRVMVTDRPLLAMPIREVMEGVEQAKQCS